MKKIIIVLLTLLMVFALIGCSTSTPKASNEVDKSLIDEDTDAMGKEVEKPEVVFEDMTIVSTAPSVTEILFALGCGDNIIGVDIYSNYPKQTELIEKVGDFNGFDIEKVISLSPDIVFASNGLQQDQIKALTDVGLNVMAVEPTNFEDIAASIKLIGAQVGKDEEADALASKIKDAKANAEAKSSEQSENPSIYYVMGIGDYGNWTSGEGSFLNAVLQMAGGRCITAGSELEWIDYPVEDLLKEDPDYLIVSALVLEEDLLADPVYRDLTAIKEGRYYYINPDIIERPGPRIIDALGQIQGYLLGE